MVEMIIVCAGRLVMKYVAPRTWFFFSTQSWAMARGDARTLAKVVKARRMVEMNIVDSIE